jgi:hypothetical protein
MGVVVPASPFVRRMLRVVRLNPLQRCARSRWGENYLFVLSSSVVVKKTQLFSPLFLCSLRHPKFWFFPFPVFVAISFASNFG